jgi:MYXO-CTERM domain-containing protein
MATLIFGALIAAAPVLVASEALAVIEPEPCGSEDIPGDADCEVVTGNGCGSMCDACDMSAQCQESCSCECAGEANEIGCIASCVTSCALELAGSCSGGCGAKGSLFCNGKFVQVDDLDVCVNYLCSLGMDLGACGGAANAADSTGEQAKPGAKPAPGAKPVPGAKPEPVSAVAGYAEPYSAPKPVLPKCAASEGSSDVSEGALLSAVVGLGLFVARRRRR